MAFKSDVNAKQAFIQKLLSEGFDSAEVKAKPSDVVARKGGETWYYEIKLTDHQDTCRVHAVLYDTPLQGLFQYQPRWEETA